MRSIKDQPFFHPQIAKKDRIPLDSKFIELFPFFSFSLEEAGKDVDAAGFDRTEADDLKLKSCTNLAGCHFQLSNHGLVVSLATEILSKLPPPSTNVKLLYRRGVAQLVRSFYLISKSSVTFTSFCEGVEHYELFRLILGLSCSPEVRIALCNLTAYSNLL